jgi:hypothetical protein
MISGDDKRSGAEYTHGRRVKAANPGMQPDVGGKTKPKSQGKMDAGTRADLMYRKANLKKEDADLEKMQKDADANRARAAKLKDRNVTRASASFAAAKVADDVKKAARTGPQQHKGTRTGVMRTEEAAMSPQEVSLQKKKAMLDKMIAAKRMQNLKKAAPAKEEPAKAMGEGLSVDDQMRISRDHNRKSPEERKAANMKALSGLKKGTPKKDTRTDAQKMTDATGPRPGSNYRGD